MKIATTKSRLIIILSILLIAAGWWGAWDIPENPRTFDVEQLTVAIRTYVNGTEKAKQIWVRGDTVTLCQKGTDNCVLAVYYNPYTSNPWTVEANVPNRKAPDNSWFKKLMEIIFGGASSTDYFPGGSMPTGVSGGSFFVSVAISGGIVEVGPPTEVSDARLNRTRQ